MEKVVFYRVWYFKDLGKGRQYYFENREDAEIARFNAYKSYDFERLTIRRFNVPVSLVRSVLVLECEFDKLNICRVKETEEITNE